MVQSECNQPKIVVKIIGKMPESSSVGINNSSQSSSCLTRKKADEQFNILWIMIILNIYSHVSTTYLRTKFSLLNTIADLVIEANIFVIYRLLYDKLDL